MRRERVWAVVGAAVLVVVAACGSPGDDDADGGESERGDPASAEAAQTADLVCTMLRSWNNDLGDVINTTSQAITDDDDPSTANTALLDGFDQMIALAEAHRAQVDELPLPDLDERQALVDELAAGADESLAVLQEERAEAAELAPIDVEGQRGAIGAAFTGVERATSVFEPEIAAYGADLRRAFEDEEGCMHVIQPF